MYRHYSGRRLWRREEKLTPILTVISGVVGSFPAAREITGRLARQRKGNGRLAWQSNSNLSKSSPVRKVVTGWSTFQARDGQEVRRDERRPLHGEAQVRGAPVFG